MVWDQFQHRRPRNTNHRTSKTDCPLGAIQSDHAKRRAANEDNEYLAAHHQNIDHDKPRVLPNTLEDIELVVQPATVEFVEDLHPYEGVEDNGVELQSFTLIIHVETQYLVPSKI